MCAVLVSHLDPAEERRRRRMAALSLLGLSAFLMAQALMVRSYARSQKRPPAWDQAVHMEIALDYREAARSGRWSDIMHLAPKPGMPPFPPLYHMALMHAYDSSDPAGAALWVNWVYLAVFCVSLFFICFNFRSDWAALGAVIAFAASPAIQELLFTQLIDLSVAAWVAVAYWALLACDDFKKWVPSLLFGAVFAVGMLHKWSFFSYMAPAYLLALRGLSEKKSRFQTLAAAGVALAGFGPWYYDHLAVLVPRLFQASSDFAVPVTRGGSFFLYFLVSADTLGPALWVLGWVALAVPNFRERLSQSWMVWAWVLTSYVFWALVPNRQMRFITPGLSALAVALCGAWPTPVIWSLAAVQLFGAVNYSTGWISAVQLPLPLHDVTLLPSNPPGGEDWHIADILRAAQSESEASAAISNLTLVANAPSFNGTNFTWLSKLLKLPSVHIRGVNQRLCEFSRFVVLKDSQLGPSGVIEGLPDAASIVTDPKGWFARFYEKAGQWPLPDGSNAVLYRQRRLDMEPFKANGVQFMFYTTGPFTANDFRAKLGPWDKVAADYPLVKMTAASMELRSLKVSHPSIELVDAVVVPAGEGKKTAEWDEVRFLRLGTLKIDSAEISEPDLKAYLQERIKGLSIDKLTLDKTLAVSGRIGHFSFSLEAAVELLDGPRRLKVTLLSARLGATPLPASLFGGYRDFTLSLQPNPETPFAIDLPGLTLRGGKLTIP